MKLHNAIKVCVVLIVETVALISGGSRARAMDAALQQLIDRFDPGLAGAYAAHYGQDVNLTQTVGNFSVNVQWIYTDANRITLAYTASVRNEKTYNNLSPRNTLAFSDGRHIRPAGGFGNGIVYTSDNVGTNAYISNFIQDPANVATSQTKLRLSVEIEAFDPDLIEQQSTPDASGNVAPLGPLGPTVGPFIFEFNVAETPRRDVTVNQTSVDQGIKLKLQNVTVTPAQVLGTLCVVTSETSFSEWGPFASLTVPGAEINPSMLSGALYPRDEPNCFDLRFNVAYYANTGEWTISVPILIGNKQNLASDDPDKFMRLAGDWKFTFQVGE